MKEGTKARLWSSPPARWARRHLPILRSYEERIMDLKRQRELLRVRVGDVDLAFASEVEPWDVVETIRAQHTSKTYLQILTPTTSTYMPGRSEQESFPQVMLYRYRTRRHLEAMPASAWLPTLDELEAQLEKAPFVADIVYVDPWHTYEDTKRMLLLGLRNLAPGGWIVCHDCLPREEWLLVTEPAWMDTPWCGETWRGWYDVAQSLPAGSRSFLVDSGVGTGVMRPSKPLRDTHHPVPSCTPELELVERWKWFSEHLDSLVDVVSEERWRRDRRMLVRG